MWPFAKKYKTLSHAVLAGDIRAVHRMLDRAADPNKCDPDDDAYPIHYALNYGPEMVQLLIDHGADVNIPCPRNDDMPLAFAEANAYDGGVPWEFYPLNSTSAEREQYTEVASVLRKAGARLRTGHEEFAMDPRYRIQLEPRISWLAAMARAKYLITDPEQIAKLVDEELNLKFSTDMPPQEKDRLRKEVRALIKKECGVEDYLRGVEQLAPLSEEAVKIKDISEDGLN